jgi:hypothetical protein
MDLADPNTPLSREGDPAASVLGLAPFAILVLHVHVNRCQEKERSTGVLYILWVQLEIRLYLGVCLSPLSF